jgi:hypothetical protein
MSQFENKLDELNKLGFKQTQYNDNTYNIYKLVIVYDKFVNSNISLQPEQEIIDNYKTYEIRTYPSDCTEYYCLEHSWSHYFGDYYNPLFLYFYYDKRIKREELENICK